MLTGLVVTGYASAANSAATPALSSSVAKTVVLDPTTGAVVSVSAGATAAPLISNHNICNTGDGCWFSGRIPFANQGFFGSAGTFHGSWQFRSGWGTGSHTASACWVQACSQHRFGPNTTITFGGTLVTGTSFTIF
jgi:hypothetical protein